MRCLRFGEIADRSINYLRLSFDENESFTYDLENFGYEEAVSNLPENCFESGMSVFEMTNDRLPRLSNLMLISSLLARINAPVYEVEGTVIGRGNDGEPLLTDVMVIKRRRIKAEQLKCHVLRIMASSFYECIKTDNDAGPNLISSYVEQKINIKTGERVYILEQTCGDDWVKIPAHFEYTCFGWTFSNPVDGFDTTLGYHCSRKD